MKPWHGSGPDLHGGEEGDNPICRPPRSMSGGENLRRPLFLVHRHKLRELAVHGPAPQGDIYAGIHFFRSAPYLGQE